MIVTGAGVSSSQAPIEAILKAAEDVGKYNE